MVKWRLGCVYVAVDVDKAQCEQSCTPEAVESLTKQEHVQVIGNGVRCTCYVGCTTHVK